MSLYKNTALLSRVKASHTYVHTIQERIAKTKPQPPETIVPMELARTASSRMDGKRKKEGKLETEAETQSNSSLLLPLGISRHHLGSWPYLVVVHRRWSASSVTVSRRGMWCHMIRVWDSVRLLYVRRWSGRNVSIVVLLRRSMVRVRIIHIHKMLRRARLLHDMRSTMHVHIHIPLLELM